MTRPGISACALPADALLGRYAGAGGFADCYFTDVDRAVGLPEFVEAFYTTALFRLERAILRLAVSRPSSDADVRRLARGETDAFAAWSVEDRAPHQLLLADATGRTRSWLKVEAKAGDGPVRTRLFFGSAVVPKRGGSGRGDLGFVFTSLLGFHKLYSRALLAAARSRLSRPDTD
jgi:hypothetical protein